MSETGRPAVLPAYADDLAAGTTFDLGAHLFSREEILAYANHWDPQSFHVDEERARDGFFADVIASGMHTLSAFQRLAVAGIYSQWAMVAGRALRDVQFRRPVLPGTSLRASIVLRSVELRHPQRALVTLDGGFSDGDGHAFMTVVTEVYVARRAQP